MKHPTTAASSSGPSGVASADTNKTDSPKLLPKSYHVSEKIMSGLSQIREDLYRTEDQQMTFIDQLEVNVHFVYLLTDCIIGQTTTVKLTVRPAENYPVDLYYLMDMSYSMKNDLEKLTKLASKIGTNDSLN